MTSNGLCRWKINAKMSVGDENLSFELRTMMLVEISMNERTEKRIIREIEVLFHRLKSRERKHEDDRQLKDRVDENSNNFHREILNNPSHCPMKTYENSSNVEELNHYFD